ncbi:zinc finger HIT domain-containing protein 2 isoform X3 [Tachypleus tridentatus]
MCPRCNAPYCSLTCYKSEQHLQCSESFYKDWVATYIHNNQQSSKYNETKQKMMKILQKAQQDEMFCSDDDDDCVIGKESLKTKMENLNLDDCSDLWKQLTKKEKKEFESMVAKCEFGELVSTWEPWWNKKMEEKLIEDLGSASPKILDVKAIPKVSDVTKRKPSDCVKYDLLNLLYGYIFICRLYNGDHAEFPSESVECIMNISPVLEGKNFGNVGEAIFYTIQKVTVKNSEFTIPWITAVSAIEDVQKIVEGPNKLPTVEYVLHALNDIKKLFQITQQLLKKEKSGRVATSQCKKTLKMSIKKIEYYFCWASEYGSALIDLLPEIVQEKLSALANTSFHELKIDSMKEQPQERKLIEEVP